MSAALIARDLAGGMDRLATHLLGQPTTCNGREWRFRHRGSLRVVVNGADRGRFSDFEADVHGDAIDLIKHLLGMDTISAMRWAKDFLGHHKDRTKRISLPESRRAPNDLGKSIGRARKALALWKGARPIADTLGEHYLRETRGIVGFVIPPCLRFRPAVYHFESRRNWPAIIAGLTKSDRWTVEAVHAIFLDPDTGAKAPIAPAKKSFGPISGTAVRFGPERSKIALAEGIETAFSIYESVPDLTVWATLGTSGLRKVELPKDVTEILICADFDEAGLTAAQDAAKRFLSQGYEVLMARPPCGAKDFNDLFRTAAATRLAK